MRANERTYALAYATFQFACFGRCKLKLWRTQSCAKSVYLLDGDDDEADIVDIVVVAVVV